MKFELSPEQLAKFEKWRLNNKKKNKNKVEVHHTFSFTPTGIGEIVKVRDDFGNELDLSEVDKW